MVACSFIKIPTVPTITIPALNYPLFLILGLIIEDNGCILPFLIPTVPIMTIPAFNYPLFLSFYNLKAQYS